MCGVLSLFQLLGCELLCQRKELGTIWGLSSTLCWKKNSSSIIVSFVVVCYLFSCVSMNTDTTNVKRWQNLGSSVVISFHVLRGGSKVRKVMPVAVCLSFSFLPLGTCRWAPLGQPEPGTELSSMLLFVSRWQQRGQQFGVVAWGSQGVVENIQHSCHSE